MASVVRFGVFELDMESERLLKNGRTIRLQPQPFRLLSLLTSEPGRIVTREEIRAALWNTETTVDFEQGVNFAMKQVREALGDNADSPLYIQTVPKRGYRFLAPVENRNPSAGTEQRSADLRLHKALWANIAELRLAEERRRRWLRISAVAIAVVAVAGIAAWLLVR